MLPEYLYIHYMSLPAVSQRVTRRSFFFRIIFMLLLLSLSQGWRGYAQTPRGKAGGSAIPAVSIIDQIKKAPAKVIDAKGQIVDSSIVRVERRWEGDRCYSTISNIGNKSLELENIILFDLEKTGLDSGTLIYGEGFQMLSQTEGTLGSPVDMSPYTDRKHYRIPEPGGLRTVYNLFTLDLKSGGKLLLGFSSSKRFAGRFSFSADKLRISIDPENLELAPGETWILEEFTAMSGSDRNQLLARFAQLIESNHPGRFTKNIPTGWCSYYYYGISATKSIVEQNLERFSEVMPSLKYIQIDEGYSPFEGDWLDNNPAFGSMDSTVMSIRKYGFLPALWVAPFIAEKNARVLREHPDWFVEGDDGKPLDSGTKGFGGWHNGPWYVLDGTNPDVQKYLEEIFRTMRNKWGITYFKLDANYWGAIEGRHFDPKATRIEAYRRGMEAIIRGAGTDAVILGCNAPMWPSLGLVTAMRTSNDIYRRWDIFAATGRENLSRAWQNGHLWINDPDCLLLAGDNKIPANCWIFHATIVHAVGGMVIDGDKAADLQAGQLSILRKSILITGRGAIFHDRNFDMGIMRVSNQTYYHSFNWSDTSADRIIYLDKPSILMDYWTGENIGIYKTVYIIKLQPGESARLIVATPAQQ